MSRYILFSFSALLLFTNADCKKNIVTSTDDIKPGRRDYVWTVDTLFTKPGDIIYAISIIWGSSPDDVWMIASADPGYQLWHYNGSRWTRDSLLKQIAPEGLYGFSPNNIWLSNRSEGANFWHYDGAMWNFFSEQPIDSFVIVGIQSINGETAFDVYAVGYADMHDGITYRGVFFHYDGNQWNEINVGQKRISFEEVITQENFVVLRGTTYEQGFPDTSKIFIYQNSQLREIYSSISPATISKIGNTIFIGSGKKIYTFDNDMKLTLWKDFSNTEFISGIQGRNEKDFLCIGTNGIMHYNGTDLETILSLSSIYTTEIMILKDDIFFGLDDYTTGKHLMIRGTLKIN
ncbi:MAG: hypothetical protein H3C35_10680 [Bacteroidetes bacterium]|nr:hypothetical protein [Bacteroidota bacterium]